VLTLILLLAFLVHCASSQTLTLGERGLHMATSYFRLLGVSMALSLLITPALFFVLRQRGL
jgi:hypothetical protein